MAPLSSRRLVAVDEDPIDDGGDAEMSTDDVKKLQAMQKIQKEDLGTATADHIKYDGSGRLHVSRLSPVRKCDLEGSRESKIAQANESSASAWRDWGSTKEAQDTSHSEPPRFKGEAHRAALREACAEFERGLGRPVTLKDTYTNDPARAARLKAAGGGHAPGPRSSTAPSRVNDAPQALVARGKPVKPAASKTHPQEKIPGRPGAPLDNPRSSQAATSGRVRKVSHQHHPSRHALTSSRVSQQLVGPSDFMSFLNNQQADLDGKEKGATQHDVTSLAAPHVRATVSQPRPKNNHSSRGLNKCTSGDSVDTQDSSCESPSLIYVDGSPRSTAKAEAVLGVSRSAYDLKHLDAGPFGPLHLPERGVNAVESASFHPNLIDSPIDSIDFGFMRPEVTVVDGIRYVREDLYMAHKPPTNNAFEGDGNHIQTTRARSVKSGATSTARDVSSQLPQLTTSTMRASSQIVKVRNPFGPREPSPSGESCDSMTAPPPVPTATLKENSKLAEAGGQQNLVGNKTAAPRNDLYASIWAPQNASLSPTAPSNPPTSRTTRNSNKGRPNDAGNETAAPQSDLEKSIWAPQNVGLSPPAPSKPRASHIVRNPPKVRPPPLTPKTPNHPRSQRSPVSAPKHSNEPVVRDSRMSVPLSNAAVPGIHTEALDQQLRRPSPSLVVNLLKELCEQGITMQDLAKAAVESMGAQPQSVESTFQRHSTKLALDDDDDNNSDGIW